MKATLKTQEALIYLLKTLGVNKNNSIGAVLMLKDSEEATKEFFLWVYDNKPNQEQIMRKAIAMSEDINK